MRTLWRINVPQIAFSYDFVMRGVLALSALHLAYSKPKQRELFNSQARTHHQIGLRGVTALLPHVTDENCTAVYIFSAITCIITLATPRQPDDLLVTGESGVSEWLVFFRGMRTIIDNSHQALAAGTLGPMFVAGGRRYDLREEMMKETFPGSEQLDELLLLIQKTIKNEHELHVYMPAIEELRKSYLVVFGHNQLSLEPGDIFVWLFRISDEYLALLREHVQEALVVFAYFCVVAKRMDFNWWIEGWSTHLISKVWHMLDEEHRLWVRWPVEEIGWIPN